MKYLGKNNQELLRKFGDRIAGANLNRDIARLYSQHTRLRAGTSGLQSWTTNELLSRLNEGEKLIIAGMASDNSAVCQRYLRRAGEIFEWAATSSTTEIPIPTVLLSASAYQLAGYPARASGILSEHPLSNNVSKVLEALLRSDFSEAQRYLIETWQINKANEVVNSFESDILDQILQAFGTLIAWLRWGDETRIETALKILDKISHILRYDNDRFSWLLAVLFVSISQGYKRDALWTVLTPLQTMVTDDGRQSFDRYARVAFLEKKMLAWPSQQAGISGIVSEGSFALCTPTGSGKTRVAELVILRHLFRKKDIESAITSPFVLYIAPSRALSAEVEAVLSRSLRRIRATSVNVTSLYGGNDFGPSDLTSIVEQPTVLISTHEKADALLRFLGSTMIGKVSCVIIDEAHTAAFTGKYEELIHSKSRSLRLESLVSRLKSLCSPHTTFVALSAVAAEFRDVLSSWITGIDGKCAIAPDYRSTRQLFGKLLCEETGSTTIQYDVLDGQLLEVDDSRESAPYVPNPFPSHPPVKKTFSKKDSILKRLRAHLLWAAMHFAYSSDGKGHSVLISVSEHPEYYAETFLKLLTDDWDSSKCPLFFTPPEDKQNQSLLSRCLASCADYFGSDSREYRLLEKGIVLHHGKMPSVMSRLLIELVQSRVINIVIATSTLSEGVNLPFETVLIPSLSRGKNMVNAKEIVNVAGRAGRPGVSTEGKTLILIPSVFQYKKQKIKLMDAYQRIVQYMTNDLTEEINSPSSSLYALIDYIEKKWTQISGSNNRDEFIRWLETTAYSNADGELGELLKSLDTLDQQLLTGIEEAQELKEENIEELLQLLWHNTLAQHDKNNLDRQKADLFKRRGLALINTIYPERSRRKALYHTGLPPRDGNIIIDQLSDIKATLQEAVNYITWDVTQRINHFIKLVETISQIEAFGVREKKIGNATWRDVLVWWMAPDIATRRPKPNNVSKWYDFASKYFINGLNWALGAVVGSILQRDGGEGKILERWRKCELPWSVLWYKDMVSWGTLDPIASYALTTKEAYTRSAATNIAAEYWKVVDEITDSTLNPERVTKWMSKRGETRFAEIKYHKIPQSKFSVKLIEDFSNYTGSQLRVLPGTNEHLINWYDPAGFLLAQSEIPDNWKGLTTTETDFFLDYVTATVTWKPYL